MPKLEYTEDLNECPDGWIFEGTACFYFNTDKLKMNLTWVSAQSECENIGGHLAEPTTEKIQKFLYSEVTFIDAIGQHTDWWIGLSDISREGNWYWLYNQTALNFSSWRMGSPNSKFPNLDDCAILYSVDHSYDWLDVNCEDPNQSVPTSFICQKPNDGNEVTTSSK